jgi:hypothetical protein
VLRDLFARMGYTHTATHKTKAVELWQQGDITYVLNAEPGSFAPASSRSTAPARRPWPGASSMRSTPSTMRCRKGPSPTRATTRPSTGPRSSGIGGSLIYFTDQYYDTSPYNAEFDWVSHAHPEGVGFYYLDHLTHNVFKGNMDVWFRFYGNLFNFREIRFFDIEGKFTGLFSPRADLALRAHPHPDQRGSWRDRADRELPEEIQGRGHPAHRRRRARHLRRGRRDRRTGRALHAGAARDLLRARASTACRATRNRWSG